MKDYDENEAAAYMRSHVPGAEAYDDDQLINLIDIIFDWYDENGDLEVDLDALDDTDEDLEAIAAYARGVLAKDADSTIAPEHVLPLIAAEVDYELSLI